MSNDEQDAIVGRTIRERKETDQKLAALKTKAHKIGEALAHLGNLLQGYPQNVIFEGQSHSSRFVASGPLHQKSTLNADEIYALCDEIRITTIESERLADVLVKMGVDTPRWPPGTR